MIFRRWFLCLLDSVTTCALRLTQYSNSSGARPVGRRPCDSPWPTHPARSRGPTPHSGTTGPAAMPSPSFVHGSQRVPSHLQPPSGTKPPSGAHTQRRQQLPPPGSTKSAFHAAQAPKHVLIFFIGSHHTKITCLLSSCFGSLDPPPTLCSNSSVFVVLQLFLLSEVWRSWCLLYF